ncbi:MAG: ATP-binding protein [Lachnospiraceae bacterium]|nr:ATP-binding protein [Lachnospiraceae bacterium]
MFAGRRAEIDFLEHYYGEEGSQLLVLYGIRGIGKTEILKEFVKDRTSSYYAAKSCSEAEQIYEWSAELQDVAQDNSTVTALSGYSDILNKIFPASNDKKILIIDEFQYIVKSSESFFAELAAFVDGRRLSRPVFIVLLSSAAGWIENSMVDIIGTSAAYIDGFMKVKEMSFPNMLEIFPKYSREDAVKNYMVLGGIPGLWQSFDAGVDFRENVIRNILCRESRLYWEMSAYLSGELRETAVYSTLLVNIARGFCRLNDIYGITGFSRAKISVYLKNLMELDLIEKVYSGVYHITNPYVKFYFRFLFPNKSLLEMLSPEEFYDLKISRDFDRFANEDYSRICRQVFADELGDAYEVSQWRGRDGVIDIVAVDAESKRAAGKCIFYRKADIGDYRQLLADAKSAGIVVDRAVLYSERGFSDELADLSRNGSVELKSIYNMEKGKLGG